MTDNKFPDAETPRQFSYRLIIGQYSTDTKIHELNRILDKLESSENLARENIDRAHRITSEMTKECNKLKEIIDRLKKEMEEDQSYKRTSKALHDLTDSENLTEVKAKVRDEAVKIVESCDWKDESPRNIWNMLDEWRNRARPKKEDPVFPDKLPNTYRFVPDICMDDHDSNQVSRGICPSCRRTLVNQNIEWVGGKLSRCPGCETYYAPPKDLKKPEKKEIS